MSDKTPEEMIVEVNQFIDDTAVRMSEGAEVDLEGVEAKVEELCDTVLKLPVDQAAALSKPLEALGDKFSALRDALVLAQNEVRQELDELNAREKAAKAYRKSDAIDGGQPPKED